jgi:hypothetical protein
VQGHDHPALLADRLKAIDLSWVSGRLPHTHWVYTAKTRYRQPDAPCEVENVNAEALRGDLRPAAMGGDARPERGALRFEGVPGRRPFKSAKRAARTGKNPKTGAAIKIAATTVPKFSAGAGFKQAVSGKKAKK